MLETVRSSKQFISRVYTSKTSNWQQQELWQESNFPFIARNSFARTSSHIYSSRPMWGGSKSQVQISANVSGGIVRIVGGGLGGSIDCGRIFEFLDFYNSSSVVNERAVWNSHMILTEVVSASSSVDVFLPGSLVRCHLPSDLASSARRPSGCGCWNLHAHLQ